MWFALVVTMTSKPWDRPGERMVLMIHRGTNAVAKHAFQKLLGPVSLAVVKCPTDYILDNSHMLKCLHEISQLLKYLLCSSSVSDEQWNGPSRGRHAEGGATTEYVNRHG
jgi:hypothetical protein